MSEFSNRIEAQRQILRIVNRRSWGGEQLFSLSSKAISRWVDINRLDASAQMVCLVTAAAEKLFFLANKSQEQVSEDYRATSIAIAAIASLLETEMGED